MRTYREAFKPDTVFHRDFHGTIFIEDLKIRDFRITPVFRCLIMFGRHGTGTAVRGVAFNDHRIQTLYQIPDQLRRQVVGSL